MSVRPRSTSCRYWRYQFLRRIRGGMVRGSCQFASVRMQVAFDLVRAGSLKCLAIRICLGGQHLVSALQCENLVRGTRGIEEPFAQDFAPDTCTRAIDETPQRHAAHRWHWHNL